MSRAKVVMLGLSGVGKSSVMLRAARNEFLETMDATLGAAYIPIKRTATSGETVYMEVWDTAGQERFDSLAPMYYRNARAAIVVYDISDRLSLSKAKYWCQLIRQCLPLATILLIGNKCDKENVRAISRTEGRAIATTTDSHFYETSACSGYNVQEVFQDLAEALAEPVTPPLTPVEISPSSLGSDETCKPCC